MKVFLIDDEQPAVEELAYLLDAYEDIEVIGTYNSPKKALEGILMTGPEAVFLDIEMPEMDGFALAEALMRLSHPPKIVFVTAYDEYAIKAFEINAVDYVLKPVMEDRLDQAVNRLRKNLDREAAMKNVIKDRYLDKKVKRLPLWKDDRIYLIKPSDVIYLECRDGETTIYTAKGVFMTTESMSHYTDILTPYGFYRCHRSFMVRIDAISEIIPWFNNTYQVKVTGYPQAEIPVSRRNVKGFKDLLSL